MRTIRDIRELTNIPVLVRASLNEPLEGEKVANTYRLRRALPTIEFLRNKGARIILAGHIGELGTETLLPVYEAMKNFLPRITFCPVSVGPEARAAVRKLAPGDVLMLENLRRNRGEVMNDKTFALELAELADVFVEDAFDVCHRRHASVVGVPMLLPSYAGLLLEEEVRELQKALKPKSPSLAIIGGAKFATKEAVLKKLLTTYDRVFVGGALANDFLKRKGYPVGVSLVSETVPSAIDVLLKNKRLLLPVDEIDATPNSARAKGHLSTLYGITEREAILDDGPRTTMMLVELIKKAKTVLWNGPLGNYENGFIEGTESIARAIAVSRAHSILGGGDTIAAIEKLGLDSNYSFVSTGGGAMLEFLANGTLPGIAVLK